MRTIFQLSSFGKLSVGLALAVLAALMHPLAALSQETPMLVTVGAANADVIGTDNAAIQKAIDRVAAAGGGTVLIKAGTYVLANSVRLSSGITLKGEGPDKTVLKKIAGVRTKLKLDADYGEMKATVENVQGFAPGMGVTLLDQHNPSGWTPSVRTITRSDGDTLYFDRFLQMDYSVENAGEVFNTFPLVAGFDVHDVGVEDLTVDGNRAASGILDGCQTGAIYFFHSHRMTIRHCVARDYPGDGISTQFVEDPVVENCEVYDNANLGIHLGTGAARGQVRFNRVHDNGEDGLYLCWRVQHAVYEGNRSWNNGHAGISLGHKDTDNLFIKNTVSGNARAGIFFRNDNEANAAHRNTFQENVIEDNGRPGAPGYGVRIEGVTHNLKFVSNTIGSTAKSGIVLQPVGIYVGPHADFVTCEHNKFAGDIKLPIEDKSQGRHNQLSQSAEK
ncbi:MAG TPA: right-handed parallel beta-helix repeat-containing protein [Terriglobia bacterium]|nr:right-handed parallel beta-helix repeat-containing protein [Terriglobia bacterium]